MKPELNLKSRYEEVEDLASYADTLSEEDKAWLNQFSMEYINASFKKGVEPLHNTPELKKSCYDRNNARNRCQLTKKKASGEVTSIEELRNKELESYNAPELPEEFVDDTDSGTSGNENA